MADAIPDMDYNENDNLSNTEQSITKIKNDVDSIHAQISIINSTIYFMKRTIRTYEDNFMIWSAAIWASIMWIGFRKPR